MMSDDLDIVTQFILQLTIVLRNLISVIVVVRRPFVGFTLQTEILDKLK